MALGNVLMWPDTGTHPSAFRSSRAPHDLSLLVTLVSETGVLSGQDTGLAQAHFKRPKAGPFQAHLGDISVVALKICHFRL